MENVIYVANLVIISKSVTKIKITTIIVNL